jgi:hypothetical protein
MQGLTIYDIKIIVSTLISYMLQESMGTYLVQKGMYQLFNSPLNATMLLYYQINATIVLMISVHEAAHSSQY